MVYLMWQLENHQLVVMNEIISGGVDDLFASHRVESLYQIWILKRSHSHRLRVSGGY